MTGAADSERARELLRDFLGARLGAEAGGWFVGAVRELADDPGDDAFCAALSKASRYLPRQALDPSAAERAAAGELVPGWDPERWTLLETGRVTLVLEHPGRDDERVERALEEAFRYSEVGEQCALYRSLALLPDPARFAWRAGEGARSNMRSVFEAACCDTPYAALHLDDVAWRAVAIKALFIGAPLWRVPGVDGRIDAELARVALDLADERRSAGRAVFPELWMCLGTQGGVRGCASLEAELEAGEARGRAGAALGLARAAAEGWRGRLEALLGGDPDPLVRRFAAEALAGNTGQRAFAPLAAE